MNTLQSKQKLKRMFDILTFGILFVLGALVLLPIWWMVRSSLMTNTELYAFPPAFFPDKWLFSNYAATLEFFPFFKYLGNTLTIIVPSVLGGTLTATMGGYAFARLRFKGKDFLFLLCVGSMLLPTMVTLLPLYILWTRLLGVYDSYLPLVLPHFCGGGAFNIFLIRQFIKSIPRELDEAATIDGAGPLRVLASIIVPAIRSAMIVVALLLFIMLWNDLLQQIIYINSLDKFTIALGLSQFKGSLGTDWSMIMSATCMSFVPGILFYLVGQRYFIEGIVMTGMKQ
ncbi:carbohydrate ABC transporter permease [Sphaerochaeta globosa]|uniref:ABC-type transporter, integral membrane subunit n=1 Tax=Sphaerochaeta globosa (strain ATCC BAA-1886 / DSM 22777 / Buddy) TaxID=158189 RepID=F0RWF7_SPHGB|nr:carbohydrate ABC transporter permease [Sphaerochaeta globosa]ADY13588.1 ABC-type transporter, integral membrane subunit [Sphaerochaeta globosa str. Buddy]